MNDQTILRLRDGLTVVPFDADAREQEYVAILPDNRHYRLTSRLHELVECIVDHRTLAETAAILSQKWQRPVNPRQVQEMAERYLAPNGLLEGVDGDTSRERPESIFSWRTTLLSPRHTRPITQIGQYLFSWPIVLLSLLLVLIVHQGMYSQLERIDLKMAQALGSSDFLLLYGLVIASVLVHELGHASACRRFGQEYGDIGFGLYLVFPVFYADVTRIWRLNRRQRVAVDLSGVYFQLLVGVLYYLLYRTSGNLLWLLAAVQIDALILLSFNPIAKFDGYWVVSDMLGVPNLHQRMMQLVQRFLGRPADRKLTLKPAAQVWLWIYMILSLGVIAFSTIWSAVHMPEIVQQFAATITANLQTIHAGWQASDVEMIGAGLIQLAPLFFAILGICLLLFRGIRSVARQKRMPTEQAVAATTDTQSSRSVP